MFCDFSTIISPISSQFVTNCYLWFLSIHLSSSTHGWTAYTSIPVSGASQSYTIIFFILFSCYWSLWVNNENFIVCEQILWNAVTHKDDVCKVFVAVALFKTCTNGLNTNILLPSALIYQPSALGCLLRIDNIMLPSFWVLYSHERKTPLINNLLSLVYQFFSLSVISYIFSVFAVSYSLKPAP